MRFYDTVHEDKGRGALCAILIFLLAVGITAGSVYLVKSGAQTGEGIKEYLSNFFLTFSENKNSMAVFKNSLISNLICAAIIFVMGFFRFGPVVTGAIIIRKGFIMGFTAASFFKFYGLKGLVIMLTTMPTVVITIPALLLFSAVSVGFSIKKGEWQKKIIISYIFFMIFIVSIFCVSSLAEGYLTTTFMGWISPKLT